MSWCETAEDLSKHVKCVQKENWLCNTAGLAGVSCSIMCYGKYLGALSNTVKKICVRSSRTLQFHMSFSKWGVRVVFITMGRSGICHWRFCFWFWLGRVALYTRSVCLRLCKDWSNVLTEKWQLALLSYPMSCTDLVFDCSASGSAHQIGRKLCDGWVSA